MRLEKQSSQPVVLIACFPSPFAAHEAGVSSFAAWPRTRDDHHRIRLDQLSPEKSRNMLVMPIMV